MSAVLALLLIAEAFAIGGEPFAEPDILDARGVPQADGKAAVHITLTPAAALRLEALSRVHAGKPLPVTLDGKVIATPVVIETIATGELAIAAGTTLDEADALALRIAGKPPLPDEFEE